MGVSGGSCAIDVGIALHEPGDAGRPVPLQHIGVAARLSREESSRQTSPLGKGLVRLCPSRRRWEEDGKRGDPGDGQLSRGCPTEEQKWASPEEGTWHAFLLLIP